MNIIEKLAILFIGFITVQLFVACDGGGDGGGEETSVGTPAQETALNVNNSKFIEFSSNDHWNKELSWGFDAKYEVLSVANGEQGAVYGYVDRSEYLSGVVFNMEAYVFNDFENKSSDIYTTSSTKTFTADQQLVKYIANGTHGGTEMLVIEGEYLDQISPFNAISIQTWDLKEHVKVDYFRVKPAILNYDFTNSSDLDDHLDWVFHQACVDVDAEVKEFRNVDANTLFFDVNHNGMLDLYRVGNTGYGDEMSLIYNAWGYSGDDYLNARKIVHVPCDVNVYQDGTLVRSSDPYQTGVEQFVAISLPGVGGFAIICDNRTGTLAKTKRTIAHELGHTFRLPDHNPGDNGDERATLLMCQTGSGGNGYIIPAYYWEGVNDEYANPW